MVETKKSGRITCGICKKETVIGTHIKLAFCPDNECPNSEENYFK